MLSTADLLRVDLSILGFFLAVFTKLTVQSNWLFSLAGIHPTSQPGGGRSRHLPRTRPLSRVPSLGIDAHQSGRYPCPGNCPRRPTPTPCYRSTIPYRLDFSSFLQYSRPFAFRDHSRMVYQVLATVYFHSTKILHPI